MNAASFLALPDVQSTLEDPAASHWLKALLVSANGRDPVDLLADLEHAARLARDHFESIVSVR